MNLELMKEDLLFMIYLCDKSAEYIDVDSEISKSDLRTMRKFLEIKKEVIEREISTTQEISLLDKHHRQIELK